MEKNEHTLKFEVNDWIKHTDEYIEMLIAQDEIYYRAYYISDEVDLNYVMSKVERFRLATDKEIKKEKIRALFINKSEEYYKE
jgi:hypothetical protein